MPRNGDLEISETLFIFSLEFSQLLLIKQVVTWQALAQQPLAVLREIKSLGLKSSVPVIKSTEYSFYNYVDFCLFPFITGNILKAKYDCPAL